MQGPYPPFTDHSLSKETDQYRQLLDTILVPVTVSALDSHRVLYLNTTAARYFGVTQEQAYGSLATSYWDPPESRQRYIEQVVREKQVHNFEARLKWGPEGSRLVRISGNLVTFNGQRAVSSVFEDITSRKAAESKLRKSEKRYFQLYSLMRLLADTVPDLIWAKDIEGNYIFSNKANSETLLQCSDLAEPIGRSHHFFASREREKGYRYTFGEICRDSDSIVLERQQAGRFLEEGYVRDRFIKLDVFKAPLFNSDNVLIGTVGTGRDITREDRHLKEKEASERRYRLLAENVRDVIWTMDENLHFTYISPSIKNLLGYSPEGFMTSNMYIHLPPESRQVYYGLRKYYRQLRALGSHGDEQKYWELELWKQDGSTIWIETVTSTITDEENNFLGIIGVTRDATSRVESQIELKKAKDEALAGSRAKSEFLANMSHEIRTPMNGILGMLQLLKNSPLNREQTRYVNTAMESGSSLLRLISDILDFSKIEAGKIEMSHDQFSLDTLLTNIMRSFETLVDHSRIHLSLNLPHHVPVDILADKFRLQQILFNLLGNSVKFTEQGRILLRVTSNPTSENRAILTFAIEDTGVGIPQSRLHLLFDPFVQADGSFRRRYSGTGLGLSIVKQLVNLMGGDISLQSAVGQGTVVTFSIPVELCENSETTPAVADNGRCAEMREARILVVEDEKINAMVISAMLGNMGHEVVVAENGQEALEQLTKLQFDCILMDIQMPEMDGIETARAIRNLWQPDDRTPPIIAVTAHAMKGDRETFLSAGMDDYITKPVDCNELESTLRRILC